MIINSDKRSLETSEGLTIKGFNIDVANPKAFEILSSGLYKDKILAVIREISCNAYDAHIAVNKKDVPITVHLPTMLEPWFAVKDEGPGLSEDDVLSLYSTYFASTKASSNDFIGAFGLGSKSPFSYVDSFTVTSCHGGMKCIYSAFKNEDGMPSITKIMEEASNEIGFEVQVPVKPEDFRQFQDKAGEFFCTFKPFPNVNINIKSDFQPKDNLVYNANDIRIYSKPSGHSFYDNSHELYLIQGNVRYPVDTNQIPGFLNVKYDNRYNKNNSTVIIEVPIGTFEVTAGRETISYTKNTVANLSNVLTKYTKLLDDDIEKQVNALSSFYEALISINKFKIITNTLLPTKKYDAYKWKGKELQWPTINTQDFTTNKDPRLTNILDFTINGNTIPRVNRYQIYSLNSNEMFPGANLGFNVSPKTKRVLVIDDMPTATGNRTILHNKADFTKNYWGSPVLLLEGTDPEAYIREVWADIMPPCEIEFKKLSDYPKPPSVPVVRSKLSKEVVKGYPITNLELSSDANRYYPNKFEKIKIADGGFFLPGMQRRGRIRPNSGYSNADLKPLKELKIVGNNVYVIQPRHIKRVEKHSIWRNLDEVTDEEILKLENDSAFLANITKLKRLKYPKHYMFWDTLNKSKDKFNPNSIMKSMLDNYEATYVAPINDLSFVAKINLYNIKHNSVKFGLNNHYYQPSGWDCEDKLLTNYPLLPYLVDRHVEIEHVIEYVNSLNK